MKAFVLLFIAIFAINSNADIQFENDSIKIVFSELDGSILQVTNLDNNMELVGDSSFVGPAWKVAIMADDNPNRFRLFDCEWDYVSSSAADSFSYQWLNDSTQISFYWHEDSLDFTVEVLAEIHPRLGQVTFIPSVDLQNNNDSIPVRLVYPIVSGIESLDTTTTLDRLVILAEYAIQRPISSWPVLASSAEERSVIAHHIFGYEVFNPCNVPTSPSAASHIFHIEIWQSENCRNPLG